MADVAGYIDTLEISVGNGKGNGRQPCSSVSVVYKEKCARNVTVKRR